IKPGRSLSGTVSGFIGGETLVYRLDDPTTGTVLTGKLNSSPTPAAVPAGWGGLATVTVPAGTSDGAHTVYAVTSPSGETGAAAILVDGTAPVAATVLSGPFGTTGADVWIFFTGEAGADFGCAVDNSWSNCTSPVFYGALTDGPHTFEVQSYDLASNWSTTSLTWTVDATVDATGPTIETTFPALSAHYQDATYNAGCGT